MCHERKYFVHNFLAAVYGVDEGLAVVVAQCLFDYRSFRGVNLERRVKCILNCAYCIHHRLCFVNSRQTYIYVENLCARINLAFCLCKDKVHVVALEGSLYLLFAGGVDSLADNHRAGPAADLNGFIV